MSVFHSISAFCNAGFDILGTASSPFPSLTGYSGNILINLVIMLLIITGGIGFLTWDDIYRNKMNFKRYRMQSKIILMTTACLILFPAVFFYICDLTKLPMGKRLLAAAFQSVTTRTAGFNTIDISEMSEASKAVMILLMLIGGSPGSTAGGMKTTTFSVLILNAIATFRSQENAGAFGRRLEYHVIKNAATIAMLYFAMFLWRWNRDQCVRRSSTFRLSVRSCFSCRHGRSDFGNHTGTSCFFTSCADHTDVSGTCRRPDPDLCSIIRKK